MGQKINPISVRLNVNRRQNSLWFSKNNYTKNLHKQILLKNYISKVFQISNLSLGPCYFQMFPKKLKVYPFFNDSNKIVLASKRSYFFRSYIQSKYSKIRKSNFRCNSSDRFSSQFQINSWKKDLLLWQNTKPFVEMLNKLIQLKKNKKDGAGFLSQKDYLIETEKKLNAERKLRLQSKEDFDNLKSEVKKDLFRFSKLTKRDKKSIYDSRIDSNLINLINLNPFFTNAIKKKDYEILIQWMFRSVYVNWRKSGLVINSKQAWYLFFHLILAKNAKYNLSHSSSKVTNLRKSYLSTKHLNFLESGLEKSLSCNTSILPIKVDNEYKSAELLANYLSTQLTKNRSYRQVLKKVFQKGRKFSFLKGIRIACSGRLGGVELAKTEVKKMGQTSLNIFSEKIDYSSTKVLTKFGIIGVKVWVCYV